MPEWVTTHYATMGYHFIGRGGRQIGSIGVGTEPGNPRDARSAGDHALAQSAVPGTRWHDPVVQLGDEQPRRGLAPHCLGNGQAACALRSR
jgi:hypothetical protein